MTQCAICLTCGVQYPPAPEPPAACPICVDERQYVRASGQAWTTLDDLRLTHLNVWHQEEERVWSVRTEPAFGIGQRAYLVGSNEGNLLWDSLTLIDEQTLERARELGGVRAIAVSHPHYYGSMIEWSDALGAVPIYIHEAERPWVQRTSPNIRFWSEERHDLFGGLALVRSGGHFPGYQVLHAPDAAGGAGALFAGDQPQVCMDTRWVSFLYSYPNMIPFDAATIRSIVASLEPLPFDRLYGAFGRNVLSDAKGVIARSAERYLRAIGAKAER